MSNHTTLSVAAILAESAVRWADSTAVISDDERVSYAQLWDRARQVAGALRERGIREGDRVAMMIPNVVDFPTVYYGVLALGAIVVPVHPLLKTPEIEHVLRTSGAALLVTDAATESDARAAAAAADVTVIATGDELDALAATAVPLDLYTPMHPLAPAAMLFTSGTSGRPKGAVLSHLNLVEQTHVALIDSFDVRPHDVVCAALPLSHVFGQSNAMNTAFRRGAALLLIRRFRGDSTLDQMIAQGATIFAGVPTMLIALLDAARATTARPPLRYVISGGSSLPEAVLESFSREFAAPIHEGYGLSETSPTALINHVGRPARAGTVGTPVWGVDVRIALPDAPTIELLDDEVVGEIVIRGHSLFLGYHGDDAATQTAVVDGWFRTGDLGRRDADGRITIVDRTKDMILRGGYNIYPREIEEVLARMPGVQSVAVFGIPDERNGQEIVAAVVAQPGSDLDDEAVLAYARERIAAHKYPRRVVLLDALPLGPSGKVLKRELSRIYG
ncbi:long-chain fatty acid--CoA ligase [soil metagenome]